MTTIVPKHVMDDIINNPVDYNIKFYRKLTDDDWKRLIEEMDNIYNKRMKNIEILNSENTVA